MGSNADDDDLDGSSSFSPHALSSLPFPLGETTLEELAAQSSASSSSPSSSSSAAAAAVTGADTPSSFLQHRIAPPLPFYRRAADGAVSLVGWQAAAPTTPEEGEWAGGQAFEWAAGHAAAQQAEEAAVAVGVLPQWGMAPEARLRALGVGGMDAAFKDVFRRVFASRLAPPELVEEMGLKHVRGVLLYGAWGDFCFLGGEKGEGGWSDVGQSFGQ